MHSSLLTCGRFALVVWQQRLADRMVQSDSITTQLPDHSLTWTPPTYNNIHPHSDMACIEYNVRLALPRLVMWLIEVGVKGDQPSLPALPLSLNMTKCQCQITRRILFKGVTKGDPPLQSGMVTCHFPLGRHTVDLTDSPLGNMWCLWQM